MPPIPSPNIPLPRLITYYQTHHDKDGKSISVLPLLMQPDISMTHVIVAAIHLNGDPNGITLNDHSPNDPRFQTLWAELRILQAGGIKVMGMLGGAAKGSYERLDGDDAQFERYYVPLKELVVARGLDGLDLDVEEEMSLAGVSRLIDRLRADFGKEFIITLAPVAAAMIDMTANLSGFDYEALEVMRGREIAWYNTQFYCGWGDFSNPLMYDVMVRKGWNPSKIVVGLVTNPANGPGFVGWNALTDTLRILTARYPGFGGVMGWEYFNSLPGENARPWEWGRELTSRIRSHCLQPIQPPAPPPAPVPAPVPAAVEAVGGQTQSVAVEEMDPDAESGAPAPVPNAFQYFSDNEH
ncbi:hypothetical protein VHEMI05588 [[Torrubiella] hemipterigena]|uniref:GH18 domain-containing protein n=1 Tax=[Torrubiella] hemipterigena TaxID=1531966 RepID=A0A0A1THF8_9HYPO|nr:hypothetical protein VHEMI05588 [[Torrubiella] hemipterigena]